MDSLRTLEEVAADISSLKIQGARRIARAALDALVHSAYHSRARTKYELYHELLGHAKILEATRPTEPMMRNSLEDAVRFMLAWVRTHPAESVAEMKDALKEHHTFFLEHMEEAVKKISKYGAGEIPAGANVLVHCHSTTIISILKRAYDEGKNPHVTCLETRPLYQGRLSARELAWRGLNTSLALDSSMGSLIGKMDLALVGADAISAEGDLINKIGTYTLAQLANSHSVRFLCAAELYKYDPLTRFGKAETIEQRNPAEVWGSGRYAHEHFPTGEGANLKLPSHIKVLNPAFDRTPAKYISAYITEEGLVSPAQLAIIAEKKIANR